MSEPRGEDAGRFTHSDNIERLLRPRHIAFIGGNSAVEGIEMCEAGGFEGPIWVVNPKHRRVAGRDCFPRVHDLPESPDATFVAVPRGPSVEVVGALARRGAGGAVAYAAGFAEAGPEGRALERDLVEAAVRWRSSGQTASACSTSSTTSRCGEPPTSSLPTLPVGSRCSRRAATGCSTS